MNWGQWGIRGGGRNKASGNELLVLMDGRSLYTPRVAGVFWDVQDTMLEDIERIEVISGPGATLWGANAVNGVINIITRDARHTDGLTASALAGTHESGANARPGQVSGEEAAARLSAT